MMSKEGKLPALTTRSPLVKVFLGVLLLWGIVWTISSQNSAPSFLAFSQSAERPTTTAASTALPDALATPERPGGKDGEKPVIVAAPTTPGGAAAAATPKVETPAVEETTKHDTLITFMYAESDAARFNIQYFVKQGLHEAADFIFIFNGETNATDFVPKMDNVRIVKRNNTCFDMGAIGEVLRTNDTWKQYKKFISINASVRGPFMPHWSSDCWSDMYLNKITDSVKLVGMTVNCGVRPHMQSMVFATDAIGMEILMDPERALIGYDDGFGNAEDPVGLSGCYADWEKAVHSEIGLAYLIRQAGYEIDVMMASFHSANNLEEYCAAVDGVADVLFDNAYFGFNVHPYETIFIKTNRDIDPIAIERLTEWTLNSNRSAADYCNAKVKKPTLPSPGSGPDAGEAR